MDRTDRLLTLAIRLVIIPGLIAAAYLSYSKLSHTDPVCATGGCRIINSSRWSEVFGIPVTLYGVVAYVTLLASTFSRSDAARLLGAFVGVGGAAFSIWLQYYALFELELACQWCLISAVAMLILAGLTVTRVVRVPMPGGSSGGD